MVDLGTYTSVKSFEEKDDDDGIDTDEVIDSLNYMDYIPRDMDENSETLPRHNRSNSRSSPAAVELSSLFRPKDDEQQHTTTSLFGLEDSETDSLPRKSNGASSYQKLKQRDDESTPRMSGSSMSNSGHSEPPTSLSSIIERQQRRGSGVWGIMRPKKPERSRMLFPPGSAVGELSSLGSIREEDNSDDEDDEDPLMEVMDYLEDELDEYTYDELIPLQIRMALEDQIFGWDHFFSSMLGHVVYTVGSYFITFWFITFLCLHEVPWGSGKVDAETDTTTKSNPWGMPHGLFSFIRTAISLGSAISTFRTIRRRRRVWLRPSRGDERRKHSLEEADQRARRFVLGSKLWGKMRRSYEKRRDKYLARGVTRKLQKAQKMFEKRHKNRVQLIRSTSNTSLCSLGSKKKRQAVVASSLTRQIHESSHHERVRMLETVGMTRKRLDSDHSTDNDDGSVGGSSVGETSISDVRSYHNSMPGYVGDSHTLPNFAMESVSHDQMPFASGEIKNVPYVHGGFFGAAPFMLTNPFWIKILRLLMPDVYVEIARRASYAPAPKLIHWAENNPVVAAYGTAHEVEFSGKVPTLEWDVFLDPYLVRRVEIVLSEKEDEETTTTVVQQQQPNKEEKEERANVEADVETDDVAQQQQPNAEDNKEDTQVEADVEKDDVVVSTTTESSTQVVNEGEEENDDVVKPITDEIEQASDKKTEETTAVEVVHAEITRKSDDEEDPNTAKEAEEKTSTATTTLALASEEEVDSKKKDDDDEYETNTKSTQEEEEEEEEEGDDSQLIVPAANSSSSDGSSGGSGGSSSSDIDSTAARSNSPNDEDYVKIVRTACGEPMSESEFLSISPPIMVTDEEEEAKEEEEEEEVTTMVKSAIIEEEETTQQPQDVKTTHNDDTNEKEEELTRKEENEQDDDEIRSTDGAKAAADDGSNNEATMTTEGKSSNAGGGGKQKNNNKKKKKKKRRR